MADVVGEFCNAVGLNASMCDFLRSAFDLLGINVNNIEDELREKGKDQLANEVVELIGADFPGGKTAARNFIRNILGKIEQRLFGETTPSSPSAGGMASRAAAYPARAIVDWSAGGISTVVYRCRDGKPVCIAEWPEGSRVLAPSACNHLTRPSCPAVFPAGTIAASDPDGGVRIAIPKPPTTGPESPAFLEVSARADIPPDVLRVSLRDFLRQTGQLPLYKDPIIWALAAGSMTVLGGAIWIRRRRRG